MRFIEQRTSIMPIAGERQALSIFAHKIGVVRVDGQSLFANAQCSIDFLAEIKPKHFCLTSADIERVSFHSLPCRSQAELEGCRRRGWIGWNIVPVIIYVNQRKKTQIGRASCMER